MQSDWNEIWHELLDWVFFYSYVIKCAIVVFCLSIYHFLCVTSWKIGIQFGMQGWDLWGDGNNSIYNCRYFISYLFFFLSTNFKKFAEFKYYFLVISLLFLL